MNRSRLSLQQMVLALVSIFLASTVSYAQGNASAQPRVVLKGHDPVAYFTEKKPVKGDPKYSHDWDGSRYLFANAENRKKFVADPERYEPQFGGYCTGSMARGIRAEADPDAWIIANGRLYVFGAVKFRDMAQNDARYLAEKVALAGQNYRSKTK